MATIQDWVKEARLANKRHEDNPRVIGSLKRERLIWDKAEQWTAKNFEQVGSRYRVRIDGLWYETDKAGVSALLVEGWERFHERN